MGKTQRKTGGAIEGRRFGIKLANRTGPRIVVRMWPSSWSESKWIVEVFGIGYRPVELVVLPASSPCGSEEADRLTEVQLSFGGAKVFREGRRIYNGTAVRQTLRQARQVECYLAELAQLTNTLKGLKESAAKETAARIAEWKQRIEALSRES